MKRSTRWFVGVTGMVLLVFGLLCLNYTKADDWERHTRRAAELGLPPPSGAIFFGGVAAIVLGAGSVGYVLGAGGSRSGLPSRT